MSVPKKYQDIDFTAPDQVAENASKGLDLRKEFERGGTEVGVARARDLKNKANLSPDTINRMTSYFSRHAVDKDAADFGNDEDPSAGYIAWLLWGGDEGREWSEDIEEKMKKADEDSSS